MEYHGAYSSMICDPGLSSSPRCMTRRKLPIGDGGSNSVQLSRTVRSCVSMASYAPLKSAHRPCNRLFDSTELSSGTAILPKASAVPQGKSFHLGADVRLQDLQELMSEVLRLASFFASALWRSAGRKSNRAKASDWASSLAQDGSIRSENNWELPIEDRR